MYSKNVECYHLEFYQTKLPISHLYTKFGGQPNWFSESEWPISRTTGEPMLFIGQIELEKEIFGNFVGKMAYIFISDDQTGLLKTDDPDYGENAVVIQPGNFKSKSVKIRKGPTLLKEKHSWFKFGRQFEEIEYSVNLIKSHEPVITKGERVNESDFKILSKNKIMGNPLLLQNPPDSLNLSEWLLLFQIQSENPLPICFGDGGFAYALINSNGTEGRFFWQD